MRIIYDVGDRVVLVDRGTCHRVTHQFKAVDQILGSSGEYQYLTLDPPGPSDVFDSTDARRVLPALTGLLYYHQQRPVGVSASSAADTIIQDHIRQYAAAGFTVYSLPLHLDLTPHAAESFLRFAASWFR